jgi:hypothetical protein
VTHENDRTTLSLPIAVRGYVHNEPKKGGGGRPQAPPSDWALVFDTETTTDPGQRLRVGYYQVRRLDDPGFCQAGLFVDPSALSPVEVKTVFRFAGDRLAVHNLTDFIEEIFFKYTFDFIGRCVGMNLPFDISRLAYEHWRCKREPYRGGFGFRLTRNPKRPTIQIKHLNQHASFIRFTIPVGRSPEQRAKEPPPASEGYRGAFIDVRTLAAGLTGQSHSLKSLSRLLKTPHQKSELDDYGAPITDEFLEYVENDVFATWECFERLQAQYDSYKLTKTPSHKIYGEASIGKAYLKQMGVGKWRPLQPKFPPALVGKIMSTYYGGRSEVRLRRTVARVLYCDFLSMYPTVCSLMDLWQFVTAKGVSFTDATDDIRALLNGLTLEAVQDRKTWSILTTIVKVQPDDDLFPIRAKYGEGGMFSIGLNRLSSSQAIWYTLADCMASALLTGKPPKVLEAIRFAPLERQNKLTPVDIAGNSEFRVDPNKDDFYRRLIELRQQTKDEMKARGIDEASKKQLDAFQQAAKITANATSYGIFVELNVAAPGKPQDLTCYGMRERGFSTSVRAIEKPGNYFHPLLATAITGAARLMLAIAETQAKRNGLDWALCDTDSFAFAKPEAMDDSEFIDRVKSIRRWYDPLVPYEGEHDLFKLEDENYSINTKEQEPGTAPLYCYAVSSKRYALFNVDKRKRPVIRKISAHGLGHLMPPTEKDLPTPHIPDSVFDLDRAGVRRWHYDVWFQILQAALKTSDLVDFESIIGFESKAVVRYAATTPTLLSWYAKYNRGLPYSAKVKPFNFMLMFHVSPIAWQTRKLEGADSDLPMDLPSVVAPYDRDPAVAVKHCFDRDTKQPIQASVLKTYAQALAQYHLHPESKFENADFLDKGETLRWHVVAPFVEYIGKEANRWQEQAHLGEIPEAQIIYGVDPGGAAALISTLQQSAKKHGYVTRLARVADMNRKTADLVVKGKSKKPGLLARLYAAHQVLEGRNRDRAVLESTVLDAVRTRCAVEGGRGFARRHRLNWNNLSAVLAGRRPMGPKMMSKLEGAVDDELLSVEDDSSAESRSKRSMPLPKR